MTEAVMTRNMTLSATTMIGDRVLDKDGEEVGRLEDLMIDLDRGIVSYAVLSFGGILGIGEEYRGVPWSALEVDTENRVLRLAMDQERIKAAPPLSKEEWPLVPDYEWLGGIYDYYGVVHYW